MRAFVAVEKAFPLLELLNVCSRVVLFALLGPHSLGVVKLVYQEKEECQRTDEHQITQGGDKESHDRAENIKCTNSKQTNADALHQRPC